MGSILTDFFQKKWNRIHINHVELSVQRNECLRRIGTNLENLENPDPFLSDCTSATGQGTDPSIRHLILACVVYKLFAVTFSSKLQKQMPVRRTYRTRAFSDDNDTITGQHWTRLLNLILLKFIKTV